MARKDIGRWFVRVDDVVIPLRLVSAHLESRTRPTKRNNGVDDVAVAVEWSLREVKADSAEQAKEIVREFLSYSGDAAAEYGWRPLGYDRNANSLRHDWKRISFEEILNRISNFPSGDYIPAPVLDGLLGGGDEARRLFRDAAAGDVTAALKIYSVAPSAEQRSLLAEYLFLHKVDSEPPPDISLAKIAYCAASVLEKPESTSEEKAAAQRTLRILSRTSAVRSAGRVGMPSSSVHPEFADAVHRMCMALFRQIREVRRFLTAFKMDVSEFYPQLRKHLDLVRDEHTSPSRLAMRLTGRLLGISESKTEKLTYRSKMNR